MRVTGKIMDRDEYYRRLKFVLDLPNPCAECPGQIRGQQEYPYLLTNETPCDWCWSEIIGVEISKEAPWDLEYLRSRGASEKCPCSILGENEAIDKAFLCIKRTGRIKKGCFKGGNICLQMQKGKG